MTEAMACETPVIAYRSASAPDLIEDGVTGFIVDNEEQAIRAVNELGPAGQESRPPPVRGALCIEPDGEGL
ncbi:glycosyltransferase [Bradyrhizobium sp. Ce-3]|uniref:glycosyltransferase n=1 Tax=Bradyrhizobium sp. Ce-3 TaxID=2913970 RepID=UPI002088A2D4|nr:hypothetical protein BRSPCE3_43810 [Bradyrhizobium sp. Ce-3]